jgi:hypothetical protein
MWSKGVAVCHNVLQQDSIQKLIHLTDLRFDIVIVEAFANEGFLRFAQKIQAPIIHVCSNGSENNMADWIGSRNSYYYVSDKTKPSQQTDLHALAGFKPEITPNDRQQATALDCAATGVGNVSDYL